MTVKVIITFEVLVNAFYVFLRATKGARNPNLDVAFTNACAAVV